MKDGASRDAYCGATNAAATINRRGEHLTPHSSHAFVATSFHFETHRVLPTV